MSQPVYTRFETRILRNKSATDDAQVPATLGSVEFFFLLHQSATSARATALEIDGTQYPARDCAVFPHFIGGGTGEILAPWGDRNSGMVALGRKYASSGSATSTMRSGAFLPVFATTQLPTPSAGEAGLLVYDSTVPTLLIWNGTAWAAV